jgi:hypothetical protein
LVTKYKKAKLMFCFIEKRKDLPVFQCSSCSIFGMYEHAGSLSNRSPV